MAGVKQISPEATSEIVNLVGWLTHTDGWVRMPEQEMLVCSDVDVKAKLKNLCLQLVTNNHPRFVSY